jgi:DNA-binding GntR family transcriptional regulator
MTKASAAEAVTKATGGASIAEIIVDRVVHAVLEHRLPPGTKLSESILCESFTAGRSTVRRALVLLADRGIVTLEANRGAFVASPSVEEARAVFEARRTIEPSIAASAARNIASKDIASLKSHLKNEGSAQRSGDHHEAIRLSGEFHVALARYACNPLLTRFVAELVARTSLIIGLFGSPGSTHCLCDDHVALVEALTLKDGAAASTLMLHHLDRIEAHLDIGVLINAKADLAAVLRG